MTSSRSVGTMEVLLVEDNPGDVRLIQKAMQKSRITVNLHVVYNGEDALRFLDKVAPFEEASRPDLMLLDLNLPGLSGQEVLATLKAHPTHRRIPVIVLTSSRAREDVLGAYEHYANSYIVKPDRLSDIFHIIETLEAFWLDKVKLPTFKSSEN